MNRWNQYGTWSEFERRRAKLMRGRVEVAILILSLFGGRALHCVRRGDHSVVHAGRDAQRGRPLPPRWRSPAWDLGRPTNRSSRYWLGYIAGALITLAAMASLVWLGFPVIQAS
jgi:hypothetical protein